MNYDKKKLYMSGAALLLASVLVCFVTSRLTRRWVAAVVAAAFCIFLLLFIKKRGELALAKRQIAWILPTTALLAISLLYIIGIRFGFYARAVYLSVIWYSLIPYAVIITASEIIRSVLLMQENKWITLISFIAMTAFDVAMLASRISVDRFDRFAELIGMVLLPCLSSAVLYTYVSKRYGALPNILYRIIISLYGVLIPIAPFVPNSLLAFLKTVLPILVLAFLRLLYERKKLAVSRRSFSVKAVLTGSVLVVMALFVMLISCRFKYGLLVIATESMTGTVDKGDAIVYKEYNGDVIQEGQVAVFEKNGMTYVHRIVGIEHINGEVRYYTKGDSNDSNDPGYITESNIVGLTDITIKYIGFPTLWMRYLFS